MNGAQTRGGLLLLSVVAVTLAGCADSVPAPSVTANRDPPSAPAPVVSADRGAVQGLIVDASYAPVDGANVTLRATGNNHQTSKTSSDPVGRFVFSQILPGTYELSADAPGLSRTQVLVQIAAGQVNEVVVTLYNVPGDVPYVDYYAEPGIIGCGFGAILIGGECGDEPITSANRNRLGFEIPPGHRAIVSETDWAGGADAVSVRYGLKQNASESGNGALIGQIVDTPVLRGEFRPGHEGPGGFAAEDKVPVPLTEEGFVFFLMTAYVGAYQQEANQTLGAACGPLIGSCYGIGVAPDFRFTHYVSVFVNGEPDVLSRHTGVPDA